MSVWPHAAFSQRATWPPSATVRQRSIALITFNWSRLTWPRLASRQAGPCSRRMSATSRTGRATIDGAIAPAASQRLALRAGGAAGSGARAGSRSWRLFLSPRGCIEPSCRACRVQATPESAECPCRPRADGLRRNDAANEERPPQPRGFHRLLEQPTALARRHRLTISATGKQPALFRRNAGVTPGRPRLPPLPQQIEDFGRKHHMSVLAAFRLHDADDHLLTVDVARSQPHHFAGP